MQRRHFDPTYWLELWQQAGGGWAATHLLRPAGQHQELDALAAELDADRREAVRRQLMAPLDGDDRMQDPLGGKDHRAASPSGPPWTQQENANTGN